MKNQYEDNLDNIPRNEIAKAIISSLIIVLAIIAIFATPNFANLGIIIGALFLIACQFLPLTAKNKVVKTLLSIVGIIIAAGSIIISLCYSSVDVGHTGFLITFGKVSDQTYTEGIHLKPFWSTMIQIDNRIQKNGHDDAPIKLTAFTQDTQQVFISYTVNYKVDRENAGKLYKEIGLDYFKTVLIPIIQESVKMECAKYTADTLLSKRDTLAQDIESDIKAKFKNNYIDLTATAIEDLGFTDEYEKAVEAKQQAKQEKLRMEQEAEKEKIKADANAYIKEKNAEGEANALLKKAQAEAEANRLKQQSLTDNLLKEQLYSKWDGKLPVITGDTGSIIDMKDFFNK